MSDYRTNDKLTLENLEEHEQLALGGLIRVMIRVDGSFSEAEEEHINSVADELGGREALWAVISRSAQQHKNDSEIRDEALRVKRPAVQLLIRGVLEDIARAETIEPGEQQILDWLVKEWDLQPVADS